MSITRHTDPDAFLVARWVIPKINHDGRAVLMSEISRRLTSTDIHPMTGLPI